MKMMETYNIINDVVCKKIVDNDLMKKIIVQVNDEGLCVISTRSSQTDSDTVFGDGYCGMDDIILYGISSDMRKMVVVYYHINNTIWNNLINLVANFDVTSLLFGESKNLMSSGFVITIYDDNHADIPIAKMNRILKPNTIARSLMTEIVNKIREL